MFSCHFLSPPLKAAFSPNLFPSTDFLSKTLNKGMNREQDASARTSELTRVLSLGAEDVDVHRREDVRVDDALLGSGVFAARVDGVGVPVGPEQRVLVQREGERVRQLPFDHHLPESKRQSDSS